MEWRAKVELFEEIRREYQFGIGTISGVAHKLGMHRRMVRQALADARPPERKRAQRRRPVVEYVVPFIESILEGDRQAPRKQRHTAHRIWQRIRDELPELRVAESTIRKIRTRAQARAGVVSTRDLRATGLWSGAGGPGGLVRGVGGVEWRTG